MRVTLLCECVWKFELDTPSAQEKQMLKTQEIEFQNVYHLPIIKA